MFFSEFRFFFIMPIIFIIYWLVPNSVALLKRLFLFFISYLLYINFIPIYALLLLFISFVTFWGALLYERGVLSKYAGIIVATIVLIPLLMFKYYNFINDSIFDLLSLVNLNFHFSGLNWPIPVGISFFTFQALGYFLDVFHKRIPAEKNLLDYLVFVSFFPQIVSGPISKAAELLPQIKNPSSFNYQKATVGLRYFLWGIFLKIALADRAGLYVALVFDHHENFSGLNCLLASFLYSIQIYADFAGYSFMAIGVGKLLGFDLINNFNHPYFSVSVSDFWRRWHVSLSRWLKDYVYIPLGGNRCTKTRNCFNILITFLISGIWHGANWTFILWGLFHGMCQIFEKLLFLQKKESKGIVRFFRIFLTFVIISFAWILFRSASITDACEIIYQIFSLYKGFEFSLLGKDSLSYFFIAFIPFIFFEIVHENFYCFYKQIMNLFVIRWMIYIFVSSLVVLIGVFDGSQFIYANF